MELEEALYAHLSTNAAVAALASTRGYPQEIPMNAAHPSWCYQRISGEREMAHDGPTGLATGRVQITCQATSYSGVKALSRAIRRAVSGYKWLMGGAGGVEVERCVVTGDLDGYGSATDLQTIRFDLEFVYQER